MIDLTKEFVLQGGTHLFLDEVHKYPNWSREIDKKIIQLTVEETQLLIDAIASTIKKNCKLNIKKYGKKKR